MQSYAHPNKTDQRTHSPVIIFLILAALLSAYASSRHSTTTAEITPPIAVSGILQLPDGSAAAKREVFLLRSNDQAGVNLVDDLELSFQSCARAVTDESGHFEFSELPGINSVVAVSKEGFRRIPISEFQESGVIRLQPFARLQGRLNWDGKPRAGVELAVRLQRDATGPPPSVYLSPHVTTADDGSFAFDIVPSERLVIGEVLRSTGSEAVKGSFTIKPLAQVNVVPDRTTTVSIDQPHR